MERLFIKLLGFSVILIIVVSFLNGCAGNIEKDSLKLGFEFSGGEPISPIFCAYELDNKELKFNEFNIKFYYGTIKLEEQIFDEDAKYSAKIIMTNNLGESVEIENINDFFTNKYKCTLEYDETNDITVIAFAFSQIITIPQELFDGDEGWINISVKEFINWTDGRQPEFGECGGIYLYYQIDGGKVTVAATELKN
jgi:hypothetical protein